MSSPPLSDDGSFHEDGDDAFHDEFETDSKTGTGSKKPRKSVTNRKLVRWNPDMDQLVLLTADIVSTKANHPIPWDQVAKHIHPWMSGEAIKQHLTKVYNTRVEANLPVPVRPLPAVRRKSGNEGTSAPNQIAHSRIGKVENMRDEYEGINFTTPVKNSGLLHFPQLKNSKSGKKGASFDAADDQDLEATPTKKSASGATGRGVWRIKSDADVDRFNDSARPTVHGGRKAKRQTVEAKNDVENDVDEAQTQPKRPKVALRKRQKVNYNEQLDSGDEVPGQRDTKVDNAYEDKHDNIDNVQPSNPFALRSNPRSPAMHNYTLPMPVFGGIDRESSFYSNSMPLSEQDHSFGTTSSSNAFADSFNSDATIAGLPTTGHVTARKDGGDIFGRRLPNIQEQMNSQAENTYGSFDLPRTTSPISMPYRNSIGEDTLGGEMKTCGSFAMPRTASSMHYHTTSGNNAFGSDMGFPTLNNGNYIGAATDLFDDSDGHNYTHCDNYEFAPMNDFLHSTTTVQNAPRHTTGPISNTLDYTYSSVPNTLGHTSAVIPNHMGYTNTSGQTFQQPDLMQSQMMQNTSQLTSINNSFTSSDFDPSLTDQGDGDLLNASDTFPFNHFEHLLGNGGYGSSTEFHDYGAA